MAGVEVSVIRGAAEEDAEIMPEMQPAGLAERIAIGEARRRLGRVVEKARYTGRGYIIERHGEPMAAIIGIEDYERLQRLENERDVRLLQKAKRKAQEFVSVEQLVNDYEKRFGEKISTPSEEG
jgi:prevent-host-death family protein